MTTSLRSHTQRSSVCVGTEGTRRVDLAYPRKHAAAIGVANGQNIRCGKAKPYKRARP